MKHALLVLAVVAMAPTVSQAKKQLKEYCSKIGGEIIREWKCPNTLDLRKGEFCRQKNDLGQELVFNGCSAPDGKYKEVFFKACIIHDLCYHHEPVTTGKSKQECDDDFLANMKKVCQQTGGGGSCQFTAQAYYLAVTKGGETAFWCSKEPVVDYPSDLDQLPWSKKFLEKLAGPQLL